MPGKVRWIRPRVVHESEGRLCTCCIRGAVDREAIREHARRMGMRGDDLVPIAATVVVRAHSEPG